MKLGDRLRSARVAKGWSLRDVERATEGTVSNGYLSLLETGSVKEPSPRHLQRLAAALGVPYPELMQLAGYLPRNTGTSEEVSGVALSADEDLTPEERAKVEEYIGLLRAARRGSQR